MSLSELVNSIKETCKTNKTVCGQAADTQSDDEHLKQSQDQDTHEIFTHLLTLDPALNKHFTI